MKISSVHPDRDDHGNRTTEVSNGRRGSSNPFYVLSNHKKRSIGWIGILFLLLLARFVESKEEEGIEEDCRIYLATSSIPNAGWGVFTTRDYQPGDTIGPFGLGIPWHLGNHHVAGNHSTSLSDFLWDSEDLVGPNAATNLQFFLPGIASNVNVHSTLYNVMPGTLEQDPGQDPPPITFGSSAVASSTSYYNFYLVATRPIAKGSELFLKPKNHEWSLTKQWLPTPDDYQHADTIITQLHSFQMNLTSVEWIDLLYHIRSEVSAMKKSTSDGGNDSSATTKKTGFSGFFQSYYQKDGNEAEDAEVLGVDWQMVAKLLPKTHTEFEFARDHGVAKLHIHERSLEWIQSNGYCLDNIEANDSTIPGAGLGAFASRAIPKGSVIVPAPLVHLKGRKSQDFSGSQHQSTRQLLLNYCYGHRKSSLVLCPTTSLALVNHHSKAVNAKLTWETASNKIDTAEEESLLLTSKDFIKGHGDPTNFNTRVMFKCVATRDIEPGEEIFLHYGAEWQQAYRDYLDELSRPLSVEEPSSKTITASMLNRERKGLPISVSPNEDAASDDDTGYYYECLIHESLATISSESISADGSCNEVVDLKIVHPDASLVSQDMLWMPCTVTGIAGSDDSNYEIEIFAKTLANQRVRRRLTNCPRDRIQFVDGPKQVDQSSFRHRIAIPDEMFPIHWRNDATTAASWNLGTLEQREASTSDISEYEDKLREVKCGLYFAPSSIPNAGIGIYTAVDIPAMGISVGPRSGALPGFGASDGVDWIGDNYKWSGSTFSTGIEHEPFVSNMDVVAHDFGGIANCHLGLLNMDTKSTTYEPILDRRTDPGAGAITDYVRYDARSRHSIKAGNELFIHYGNHWFEHRKNFADVPFFEHFKAADYIISSIWSLAMLDKPSLSDDAIGKLLNISANSLISTHRTRMALLATKSKDDIRQAVQRNGTAHLTVKERSLDWLDKYGSCMDHVYIKDSTLLQAGKGAFARRPLSNGTSIVSTPLVPSFDYPGNQDSIPYLPGKSVAINPKTLRLNYHYGHKNSSVMFLPTTSLTSVNHRSNRMKWPSTIDDDSKEYPNAKIQWSKLNQKSEYFLQRSLHDLRKEKYSTIFMEIVATRDIEADEEIFIDYGEEWEEAWVKHVAEYQNPCSDVKGNCFKSSKMVADMNTGKFNPKFHEWSEDHFIQCRINSVDEHNLVYLITDNMAESSNKFRSYRGIERNHDGFELAKINAGSTRPCKIVASHPGRDAFDVIYFLRDSGDVKTSTLEGARYLLPAQNVPQSYLKFVTTPFHSDMFSPTAFRHKIGIPDDMFPPLWKNLS